MISHYENANYSLKFYQTGLEMSTTFYELLDSRADKEGSNWTLTMHCWTFSFFRSQQSKLRGVDPSEKSTQNLQANAYNSVLAIAQHWTHAKCPLARAG